MDTEKLNAKYSHIVEAFNKDPLLIDSYVLGVIKVIVTFKAKGNTCRNTVKEIKEILSLVEILKEKSRQ